MKKISTYIIVLMAMCSLGLSCSKKIDEAHLNPNTYSRVLPEELLPQLVNVMAANAAGHGPMNDNRYFGAYIQNWQYALTESVFDKMGFVNSTADVSQSIWRMHYFDIGFNNLKMMQWATEEQKWDYVGVGNAIFAWSWMTLTDVYGEVILKEAFDSSKVTFNYDTQQEVYEHVKKLCFVALENLNRTDGDVGKLAIGDAYFYNGDVNKWKKFVYGLLARVHNRYSNKGAAYKADSVIYYANLAMTNNTDNAMVKFAATSVGGTNNFYGPLRGNLTSQSTLTPTAIRQGKYIADLMSGANDTAFTAVQDPRAIYLLRLNNSGTFKGVTPNKGQNCTCLPAAERPENFHGGAQHLSATPSNASNNNLARYIFRNEAPVPIMTAAEMKFLKAEAQFRSGDKGGARLTYREGIELHFDMLATQFNVNIPTGREITTTNRDNYLNDTKVFPAVADFSLRHIMLQKYIAMFGYGVIETWVDMRRFHYTDLDPALPGQVYAGFKPPSGPTDLFQDNNGKLVYRYYPRFNSEYVWNASALIALGAHLRDYHTVPTWFATN